jgi:hypothetical protein
MIVSGQQNIVINVKDEDMYYALYGRLSDILTNTYINEYKSGSSVNINDSTHKKAAFVLGILKELFEVKGFYES